MFSQPPTDTKNENTKKIVHTEEGTGTNTYDADGNLVKKETGTSLNYIPDIVAADIYLGLEKEGFEKTYHNNNEWLYEKKGSEKYFFAVSIVGDSPQNIIAIKATCQTYNQESPEDIGKGLFLYLASIPYKNAKTATAADWISKNLSSSDVSTNISGVNFSITGANRTKILTVSVE